MQESLARKRSRDVAIVAVLGLVASAIAVLNLGGAPIRAAAQECEQDGGGGSPSPTSTGTGTGTASPSPSATSTGGPLPSGLPLPTQSTGTPTQTGTGSPTPTSSPPPDEATRCESQISIRFVERYSRQDPRNAFKGRVRSDDSLCIRGRKVLLKRRTGDGSRTVGRTKTNRQGRWKVFENDPKGRYFAQTPEVRKSSDHGDHICEAAKSRTIRP